MILVSKPITKVESYLLRQRLVSLRAHQLRALLCLASGQRVAVSSCNTGGRYITGRCIMKFQ